MTAGASFHFPCPLCGGPYACMVIFDCMEKMWNKAMCGALSLLRKQCEAANSWVARGAIAISVTIIMILTI